MLDISYDVSEIDVLFSVMFKNKKDISEFILIIFFDKNVNISKPQAAITPVKINSIHSSDQTSILIVKCDLYI